MKTLVILIFLTIQVSHADDVTAPTTPVSPVPVVTEQKRAPAATVPGKHDLNFDDEVLEGMNKSSMDSVESLSKHDGLDNGHLYHKKENFRTEMHDSSQEAGFLP